MKQDGSVPVPWESQGGEDIEQGGTAFLHPVMAVEAPDQDKGGVDKNILMVSPVPINRNVTLSKFQKVN